VVKKVRIIGVPVDLGADRRGVDMGPSAIRYAGIVSKIKKLGIQVEDRGNISVAVSESSQQGEPNCKYLNEISQYSELLAQEVLQAFEDKCLPLVIGGDHSIAIGAVAGAAKACQKTGLIWFDSHGDFNTPETTSSGNIHGMPLAVSTGRGADSLVNCGGLVPKVAEENTVLIGIRSLDEEEARLMAESKMTIFTMKEVDRIGIRDVVNQALVIAKNGTSGLHISLDMDAIDPITAPGVGTPVRGGLSYREIHLAMELIAEEGILTSIDISEVNPILDQRNATAELAVELVLSMLGKTIL